MSFSKYFIIDTNIILEDATNLFKLSQNGINLVILPETVLDEIDSKKSGFDEINFQAREFARILENATVISTKIVDNHKIISMGMDKTVIDVISKEQYDVKSNNMALNIFNDRKIIELALFCEKYYSKDAEFLSLDIMARIRAISVGLKAKSLEGSKEEFDYEFVKDIQIEFDDLETLNNQDITNYDTNYKYHNYSYCFNVKNSDQVVLATIEHEKIRILDEMEIRSQIITPLNKEQLFFSNAINEPYFNILVVDAKAGSGKTLLGLSGAIKLVRKKQYQKIIYIRNSIESLDKGEDVGYLPGLEEKFQIYNHPLMDSLNYMVRSENKRKYTYKDKLQYKELDEKEVETRIENMIENYGIETMWVGEMRGRTLSNSFIIIDEAQNMSNKTMQMVLSRIDNSCKVIILGSNKQIDNFYVNKYTNSLTTILKSTKEKSELVNIFAIKLKKVLRGPITAWAEDIFTK